MGAAPEAEPKPAAATKAELAARGATISYHPPVEPPIINWDASSTEDSQIRAIAERYLTLVGQLGEPRPLLDLRMDLTAVHLNGCPLDLEKLAEASDFMLAHDIQGIGKHLDRLTGRLPEGVFLPRCALTETPTEQV